MRGVFSDAPLPPHNRLTTVALSESTTLPFICSLRPVCEVIFDMLLEHFHASLIQLRNELVRSGETEGKSADQWDAAIGHAEKALQRCRDAEVQRIYGENNAFLRPT